MASRTELEAELGPEGLALAIQRGEIVANGGRDENGDVIFQPVGSPQVEADGSNDPIPVDLDDLKARVEEWQQ